MYIKIISLCMLVTLIGCSAHLRESSFITQDEGVQKYKFAELKNWQESFENHELREINLMTKSDNINLKGLLLDSPTSEDVIFYIQGNGMKVSRGGLSALKTLANFDKDIVFFDRRGLGGSEGKATIANLVEDAIEEYQFIKNKLKAKSIIVHGYSLGSFVAGQLVKTQSVDGLILQGSATNVEDWIDKKTPWYTKPFLTIEMDEAFKTVDNELVVTSIYRGPLLIIGAENDQQVPVELSSALYNASNSINKKLIIVDNADHSSMLNNSKEILLYQEFLETLN